MAAALAAGFFTHVRTHKLGEVHGAETGFVLERRPDTVRAPDVAFVAIANLEQRRRRGDVLKGPPDLTVEIVSPGDRHDGVEEQVFNYLQAGTRMVVVLRPRTKTITVDRSRDDSRFLAADDTVGGADVLARFRMSVGDIFALAED
jgi:Uma2 family endonuclease